MSASMTAEEFSRAADAAASASGGGYTSTITNSSASAGTITGTGTGTLSAISSSSSSGKVGEGAVKVHRKSDKLEAYLQERRPACVVKALAAATPRGSLSTSPTPPPPPPSSMMLNASMTGSLR